MKENLRAAAGPFLMMFLVGFLVGSFLSDRTSMIDAVYALACFVTGLVIGFLAFRVFLAVVVSVARRRRPW